MSVWQTKQEMFSQVYLERGERRRGGETDRQRVTGRERKSEGREELYSRAGRSKD